MTKRQKEQNDRFNALPHNKQRVEIAKDVLKWISLGKLKPTAGSYLWIPNKKTRIVKTNNPEGSFQDLVMRDSFKCDVCAKGALFVCAVARKDKVLNNNTRGMNNSSILAEKLGGVFSAEQLALIEAEFEGSMLDSDFDDPGFMPSLSKSLSDRMRLIAIMQNIIKNNGTFKPIAKK